MPPLAEHTFASLIVSRGGCILRALVADVLPRRLLTVRLIGLHQRPHSVIIRRSAVAESACESSVCGNLRPWISRVNNAANEEDKKIPERDDGCCAKAPPSIPTCLRHYIPFPPASAPIVFFFRRGHPLWSGLVAIRRP